jgi:hypothetical protein
MQSRAASKVLFEVLVGWIRTEGASFSITVEVCGSWVCRWPRPPVSAEAEAVVEVKCDAGMVDLQPLVELGRSCGCPIAKKWVRELTARLDTTVPRFCVLELMAVAAASCQLQPFFAQLGWTISVELERALGGAGKKGLRCGGMAFKWMEWSQACNDPHMTDRALVQYMGAAQELAQSHHVFGLATDKGTVGAMPLQLSLVTLPTKHALLRCPQVGAPKSAEPLATPPPHPDPPQTKSRAPARQVVRCGSHCFVPLGPKK